MINRAKCKLCQSIIESHLSDEIIYCKCGEIAVCDGPAMRMLPLGSKNFVRVDDMGNEIVVQYIASEDGKEDQKSADYKDKQISVKEAIEALEGSINYNQQLPVHEKYSFVTCAEMTEYLKSIVNILRSLQS